MTNETMPVERIGHCSDPAVCVYCGSATTREAVRDTGPDLDARRCLECGVLQPSLHVHVPDFEPVAAGLVCSICHARLDGRETP